MTAQIAAYGRLVDDPQVKQTSKGTPMTLARMAVSLPCSQAQDGQATLWLSVIAFGKQADQLAGHEKGNVISVSGVMQISQWTGQNGETRQGYQVIADSVISAKTVRPGGSRRKTTGTQGNQPPAGGDDPYGDDIPF
ncbi:single-stranded DNA-binding protein [Escherichia coli]|uniref:single-stranded DNA-binding protein n=1 Tax=Escherichia coli TaxID=562 RepID=UPI0007E41A56|nr:single-stranded DNA-binding protein [Escherichia coli]HDR9867842.1 single-stranded DNA-binding protein [Escherichia coli 88817 (10j)]EEZ1167958.1 single-stranded DNA-binding protein [Escherichia coli]EFA7977900.1 single-stranded DNA-binding protein [Escherichia coli]EFE0076438.1 single-stranded DNA-binding protein [Escherichia coli]EFE0101144.1 single-stranded DNA-binding protein [Escherichia coli]